MPMSGRMRDGGVMSAVDSQLEQHAIDAVAARLAAVFTDVSPDRVEDSLQRAYRRFENSRVRSFVPLLVEHAARDELAGR